jgi:hypothetical protein
MNGGIWHISGEREIPVLIGLSKTKDDFRKLSHEGDRSMIHKLEAAGIVWLGETVGFGESVYSG